jgi:hypothetical protein
VIKDYNYYFSIKNGDGNKFLKYSKSLLKKGKKSKFIIQYSECTEPLIEDGIVSNLTEVKTDDHAYLKRFMQNDLRENTILFTFDDNELDFWKFDSDDYTYFSSMKQTDIDEVVNAIEKECNIKNINEITGINSKSGLSHKLLDVKHIASIGRDKLPAFLDSLSSYRWLTAGTFRQAICNINWDFNKIVDENKKSKIFTNLELNIPFHIKDNFHKQETVFGKFVRLYFDWICSGSSRSFQEHYNFTCEQILSFTQYIMSPVQLEYASALLARDLGFTPLYNIGKAIKDIDVRATSIHHHRSNDWKKSLKRMGIDYKKRFSTKVIDSLESGHLNFQCKNYFHIKTHKVVTSKSAPIIYFSPVSPVDTDLKDWISLEELITTSESKYLSEFFSLCEYYYKNMDSQGEIINKVTIKSA